MAPGVAVDIEKLKGALEDSGGGLAIAARQCGLARSTVSRIVNGDPELREMVDDMREELLDQAELSLRVRVLAGDMKAVEMVLKYLGRGRGYVQHHQLTGADGQPLDLTVPDLMQRALAARDERLRLEKLDAETVDVTPAEPPSET